MNRAYLVIIYSMLLGSNLTTLLIVFSTIVHNGFNNTMWIPIILSIVIGIIARANILRNVKKL